MKKTVLAAAALAASVAAAPGASLFELHVESAASAPNAKAWVLRGRSGGVETVFLDPGILLDQASIATAEVEGGPDGAPQIRLSLTSEGAQKLSEITMRHVGRRLGIVLDGQLRAAPFIMAPQGSGILVVSGGFTHAEATELARKLAPPPAISPSRPVTGGMGPGGLDASALRDLQGAWTMLNATMNGRLTAEPKLVSSTWTFHENELAVTSSEGQTQRYALTMGAGMPRAFHLEPIPPSRERGGWMIFAREAELLKLAFGDNLEGRPDSFGPAPKRVVMKLARRPALAAHAPCEILEAAGLSGLLPGGQRQPDRERTAGGPACAFADPMGQEVTLLIVPAAGRIAFDSEVDNARKRPRRMVQDEPALGAYAVSVAQGYLIRFFVLKRETLVALSFQIPGADAGRLREFAKRVLGGVP